MAAKQVIHITKGSLSIKININVKRTLPTIQKLGITVSLFLPHGSFYFPDN